MKQEQSSWLKGYKLTKFNVRYLFISRFFCTFDKNGHGVIEIQDEKLLKLLLEMGLINFFKKDNSMFYGDSLEVLIGVNRSLKECSDLLSNCCINDFKDKLKNCGNALLTITNIIDRFNENWNEHDNEKICSTLVSTKDYINYYIRLCDSSTCHNYKQNVKYMIDSINTILLVINMKIRHIEENKFSR